MKLRTVQTCKFQDEGEERLRGADDCSRLGAVDWYLGQRAHGLGGVPALLLAAHTLVGVPCVCGVGALCDPDRRHLFCGLLAHATRGRQAGSSSTHVLSSRIGTAWYKCDEILVLF